MCRKKLNFLNDNEVGGRKRQALVVVSQPEVANFIEGNANLQDCFLLFKRIRLERSKNIVGQDEKYIGSFIFRDVLRAFERV